MLDNLSKIRIYSPGCTPIKETGFFTEFAGCNQVLS